MRFDYTERFVTIDDLVVRYWDEGQGEPLLLIHGMGACLETWAWNIEVLSARHRVIAPDLPGFGKSSRPSREEVFSLQYGGTFLRRFVDTLGITSLSVAGNSMGGVLALQFALMYPEVLRCLILVDSGGLGREVPCGIRIATLPVISRFIGHPPRPLIRLAFGLMILRRDSSSKELTRRIIEYLNVPGTMAATVKMARTGIDLRGQTHPYSAAELSQILAPTLAIWGEKDVVVPIQHAETALHAMQDCRAVVLSRAGHAPQIDQPEAFNELVLEFLATGRLAREDTAGKQMIHLST